MSEAAVKTQGVGVVGLLGVAFVVLKLCNVIDWSCWLVLLPFYGGLALFFGFLAVVLLLTAMAAVIQCNEARKFRWRR